VREVCVSQVRSGEVGTIEIHERHIGVGQVSSREARPVEAPLDHFFIATWQPKAVEVHTSKVEIPKWHLTATCGRLPNKTQILDPLLLVAQVSLKVVNDEMEPSVTSNPLTKPATMSLTRPLRRIPLASLPT